jgi:hypothetical protein
LQRRRKIGKFCSAGSNCFESFTVFASSNPNYFEKFEEVVKKRRDMILDINENGEIETPSSPSNK